ncbi:MAG: MarR family winged helix-turn-helix transcriptional regulator [Brevundimonas sp.]|uniref:MarR family winged helix-turn-helix transcriptional regulator n=1 Tax=Brevundimonas sp. TaxID=1871086 RepID=UPI00391AFD2D
MTKSPSRPLEKQLCFSVYSAALAIGRAYKPLLDDLQLTYPQYLVLSVLWENGIKPVGAIADQLSLETSTLTPLLKRLEAGGLVTRTRNPEDERQVLIDLTPVGRDMEARSRCLNEKLLENSAMTVRDIEALNDAVRGLTEALGRDKAKSAGR